MKAKLLLDANLSWRLVKLLQESFPGTEHVDNCDLTVPARDKEIWEYALREKFVIVYFRSFNATKRKHSQTC